MRTSSPALDCRSGKLRPFYCLRNDRSSLRSSGVHMDSKGDSHGALLLAMPLWTSESVVAVWVITTGTPSTSPQPRRGHALPSVQQAFLGCSVDHAEGKCSHRIIPVIESKTKSVPHPRQVLGLQ